MSGNSTAFSVSAVEEESRTVVRFPAGTALTEANAEELERELVSRAANRAQAHLVVDLSGITLLTSVILAKFIAINRQVRAAGGRLTLSNPTSTVRMVFTVTRLDTLLDIQQSTEPLSA